MTSHFPLRRQALRPGLHRAAGLLLGVLCAGAALAADPPPVPPPSDVPPEINPLVEDSQQITRTKNEHIQKIERVSETGGQTEVRVTNDIGTYVVKPNQNVGTSLPGDAQSNSNNPVQWVLKSWGGSKSTDPDTNKAASPDKLPPNPNASPAPSTEK